MAERVGSPWKELADAAFRKAAQNAIREAKQSGTPLIIWRDGKVCEVRPEDLEDLEISHPSKETSAQTD